MAIAGHEAGLADTSCLGAVGLNEPAHLRFSGVAVALVPI